MQTTNKSLPHLNRAETGRDEDKKADGGEGGVRRVRSGAGHGETDEEKGNRAIRCSPSGANGSSATAHSGRVAATAPAGRQARIGRRMGTQGWVWGIWQLKCGNRGMAGRGCRALQRNQQGDGRLVRITTNVDLEEDCSLAARRQARNENLDREACV